LSLNPRFPENTIWSGYRNWRHFADRAGVILGGQVSGGSSVGELINVIALAIQKKVTVRELDMMQIATHPLLTSAPTVHPLINAAHQALAKLRSTIK